MAAVSWLTTGNAGTDPTANYLGTTDNQPLAIAINGTEAMRVTSVTLPSASSVVTYPLNPPEFTTQAVSIGTDSPDQRSRCRYRHRTDLGLRLL